MKRSPSSMSANETMRRVAIIFFAREGGVPRSQVTLANALSERGVSVSVITPRAQGSFLAQLLPTIELVNLGASSHLSFVLRLARHLRRCTPQYILASQHHAGVVVALAKLLGRCSASFFVVIHNNLSSILQYERHARLLLLLMRVCYRQAEAIIGVSQGVAADLERHLPRLKKKLRVAYDLVPLDEVQRLGQIRPCGDPWLDDKQIPVFVAVGRLSRQKDFSTLLKAVASVHQQSPCRLLVIGDGEERQRLQALVQELHLDRVVRFTGRQANPYKFMSKADALIVSSRWEGFCLVIVEALALGLPVISTDCPSGPAEILEDGRYGRLVPVGDVDALANAMQELLNGGLSFSPTALQRRAAAFAPDNAVLPYLCFLGGVRT